MAAVPSLKASAQSTKLGCAWPLDVNAPAPPAWLSQSTLFQAADFAPMEVLQAV